MAFVALYGLFVGKTTASFPQKPIQGPREQNDNYSWCLVINILKTVEEGMVKLTRYGNVH